MTHQNQKHLYPRGTEFQLDHLLGACVVDADTGCWIWHGRAKVAGKSWSVHRLAWTLANGPIPAGMTVDHMCFVTSCCNPEHLQLLTNVENARRQRSALSPTCKRGHPFTPENTWNRGGGRRTCKTCQRQRIAERAQRRGAA